MPEITDIPVCAIVVAAGKGMRLDTGVRKQYLHIAGRSILSHTLTKIDACPEVGSIYLAVPAADFAYCTDRILPEASLRCPVTLVAGGEQRQNSVFNALEAIGDSSGLVAVHDGVRPLIDPEMISRCVHAAVRFGACVPGIQADDTIKKADVENRVTETVDRNSLWLVQTPQVFRTDLLHRAHRQALLDGISGTDDASLVERIGHRVMIIAGSKTNLKITTASDLAIAEALLLAPQRSFEKRPLP
jgi:2-C-methyl-D-erythritol 4-phosphate cytidylyltransferase